MNISSKILEVILSLRFAFMQERSFKKFIWLLYALFGVCGRHTISALIFFLKREEQDWSSIYRLFSKTIWDPDLILTSLLEKTLHKVLTISAGDEILIAIDDFRITKTSKYIPDVAYQRCPKSPAFHPNLVLGHRYLHATIIVFRKKRGRWQAARSIPISIKLAPHIKKPGKRASEEIIKAYKTEKEIHKLTNYAVQFIRTLRKNCDQLGYADKKIVVVADGSYCNKTVFKGLPDRVELIARCRKDAKLCKRSQEKKRFYDTEVFTPQEIRHNTKIVSRKSFFFYGGRNHLLRFKEMFGVYWKTGSQKRSLRALVIYGLRYRKKNGKTNYKQPLYLLTTDQSIDINRIVQFYLYRWEIEVNHRELKTNLGMGESQIHSKRSVKYYPKFVLISYSVAYLALLLLEEEQGDLCKCCPTPKWYNKRKRVSIEDIKRRIRQELVEDVNLQKKLGIFPNWKQIANRSAA